jgi:ABC-type phosphate transport system substrate-binding protein
MKKLLVGVLLSVAAFAAQAQITGAGATFPAPIYSKWAVATA